MSHILVYSRAGHAPINATVELICENLNGMGHQTEQTFSTNWARIFLNNYDLVHMYVECLPLTVNELFFISLAKTLRKPTVLSLFNSDGRLTKPLASVVCPDLLTVSQTNHFQYYRDWLCSKALLPLIPQMKAAKNSKTQTPDERPFLIPIESALEQAFQFKTQGETYFDARGLAKSQSASALRKEWNRFLKLKKIKSHDHLILSEEKFLDLTQNESLRVVLASPNLTHTEFTTWLEKTLNRGHLLYINEFQATSFSQAWKAGANVQIISSQHWPAEFNKILPHEPPHPELNSTFKMSELTEPLMNEISRLYTKMIRQNSSLLSPGSAKMKL